MWRIEVGNTNPLRKDRATLTFPEPSCPKCHGRMQTGFVLDRTHGANLQSFWIAGEPQMYKLFGMSTGTLHIEKDGQYPVTCFRCQNCGFLEFYAASPQTVTASETLLRPARGTDSAASQELLRGSSETPPADEQ